MTEGEPKDPRSGNSLLQALQGFGKSPRNALGLDAYMTAPPPPPLALRPAHSLWFNQKDVVLDGWSFTSCRFDKCRLYLSSQFFELVNCHIDAESVIYYQNNTVNIIRLFNSRFGAQTFQHPYFTAQRNEDGTISIVR